MYRTSGKICPNVSVFILQFWVFFCSPSKRPATINLFTSPSILLITSQINKYLPHVLYCILGEITERDGDYTCYDVESSDCFVMTISMHINIKVQKIIRYDKLISQAKQ